MYAEILSESHLLFSRLACLSKMACNSVLKHGKITEKTISESSPHHVHTRKAVINN